MCSDFSLNKSAVKKDEKLQSKYACCADQPSAPGYRTDGAINRCMGSVSATSGPDTKLQVPDEILNFTKNWHENEFFQGRSETL